MTIQQRSRSRNSDYDTGYEPDCGPVRANQDHRLDEFGLSIYREANSLQLERAIHQMAISCLGYIVKQRGEGHEMPSAINILETREARRILCIGNLAVQDVNDYLYCNIPSLHTTIKIETDDVELFGWNNSAEKTLGITVKEPELSELLHERTDIIDGLNRLTHDRTDEYSYIHPKTPHISLARINPDTPQYIIERTKEAIRCAKPAQLILKKAVIYYPGTKKPK